VCVCVCVCVCVPILCHSRTSISNVPTIESEYAGPGVVL